MNVNSEYIFFLIKKEELRMSIPSDIGGVPNVGDQATRITIQQSLGGAFAGVGNHKSGISPKSEPRIEHKIKAKHAEQFKYNGIHDIVRELNAIDSVINLENISTSLLKKILQRKPIKVLEKPKLIGNYDITKLLNISKKHPNSNQTQTSFKKIEKFKSFLSSIPTERLNIEKELEPAELEQKGFQKRKRKKKEEPEAENRKSIREKPALELESLPPPPLLGTVEASAGDEEKAQVSEENAEIQARYNQQYIQAVAQNAGKVDEEKMRSQLASAGVRDKSSQDLLIQRQVLKNLGLPEQDAEKKETDYNREQLLADLKPRQLLDDNVLLPLQPNRMSDGGPSFRYGSELQTNLETQKRIMEGAKIISRNVVEHFQPQRQKLIEKMIESKDTNIKNIELAKISEEERAELSIEKQVLVPQSQSLGYTVTDPNMTRRGPMD